MAQESHVRSIAKAISWRVTGTVDTFVLSFLITGSVKFAGSIAGTELATKIALYYGHERVWSTIRWGREKVAPDRKLRPETTVVAHRHVPLSSPAT